MIGGLIFVFILFAAVIGASVMATRAVRKSSYDPFQKGILYGAIWLLPVLGAILCYGLARQRNGIRKDYRFSLALWRQKRRKREYRS